MRATLPTSLLGLEDTSAEFSYRVLSRSRLMRRYRYGSCDPPEPMEVAIDLEEVFQDEVPLSLTDEQRLNVVRYLLEDSDVYMRIEQEISYDP